MHSKDLDNAGAALEKNDKITVMTSGRSMYPMLRQHRDLAVIKRVDRDLKKGDVVLYPERNGKFIMHRIVRIQKNRYIIRGDNNYFTEKDVSPDSIIGLLEEFFRDGKYISCESDRKYKLYVFYILHSYCIRYFLNRIIRPILSKIKHTIFK